MRSSPVGTSACLMQQGGFLMSIVILLLLIVGLLVWSVSAAARSVGRFGSLRCAALGARRRVLRRTSCPQNAVLRRQGKKGGLTGSRIRLMVIIVCMLSLFLSVRICLSRAGRLAGAPGGDRRCGLRRATCPEPVTHRRIGSGLSMDRLLRFIRNLQQQGRLMKKKTILVLSILTLILSLPCAAFVFWQELPATSLRRMPLACIVAGRRFRRQGGSACRLQP